MKVCEFTLEHLTQLGRYIEGIQHIIRNTIGRNTPRVNINGWLIVSDFDQKKDCYWIDQCLSPIIQIYTTTYDIDGLKFMPSIGTDYRMQNFKLKMADVIDSGPVKELYKKVYMAMKYATDFPF